MIAQGLFDRFVEDYNQDYKLILTRASVGHYNCLITSFMILKDLYNVIGTIYDTGDVRYTVMPFPFTFRSNDVLLRHLGFDEGEIVNIYAFLDYVKETQGMELEECLEKGTVAMCSTLR